MEQLKQVAEAAPKQVYSLWEEFKGFAFKGNVVDLALGVVIGAAFARIVDSLVKSIIMPLIAAILPGDQSYTKWSLTLNGQEIPYGVFLGEMVNFLLLAGLLFLFVYKFLGWIIQAKKAEAPKLSRQEELLTEIRDLLVRTTPPGPSAPVAPDGTPPVQGAP